MSNLSPLAKQLVAIRGDFLTYAPACLKIRDKQGQVVPLTLNKSQLYLHTRIEDQIARTGMCRMYVLKGRQQGISTYIAGRFYWQASGTFGITLMIMTHLADATSNLFGMVKHYHDNVPEALRPGVKNDNAKELNFDTLHTKYKVTTAGSRNTGRSATAQRFHGSEVAFWANADAHMAGIGQVVPVMPGTEVLLESTANGLGNRYHKGVMQALKGRGDYELVFIPWFWQTEYARIPPDDWVLDEDDLEYMEAYGISLAQAYWRRLKIDDEFSGDYTLFDQEYPATPAIAFFAGSSKALIKPILVANAIANHKALDNSTDALILGVDPAEYGEDDSALVLRRGPKVLGIWTYNGEGNAQIAGRVMVLAEKYERTGDPIDAIVVDASGVGTGVEAFLTDENYRNVYRIHNGSDAIEKEKYQNRASENWALMRDWFQEKDPDLKASLPARDGEMGTEVTVLEAEASARWYDYDGRRRVRIETKEHMRGRGIDSPDVADALALTFAVRIKAARPRKRGETLAERLRRLQTRHRKGGTPGLTR